MTDEAPHSRDYASLDNLRIPVLIPRRHPVTLFVQKNSRTKKITFFYFATRIFSNDGRDKDNDDNVDSDLSNRIRGWSTTDRARRYVLCHNKLQKRRTGTAVTATGSRATTCEVGNVLLALVPNTKRVSSASISRRGMPHALTALRRRGLVAKSNRFPAARSSGAGVAANTTSYMCR